MDRRRLLASLVAVWTLAGCTGLDAGATTTPTPTASEPEYDVSVFDQGGVDRAIIDGGIAFPGDSETRRHVAPLRADGDRDRPWMELIEETDPAAAEFVTDTDFGTHYLVVYREYPPSSVPDGRVTQVRRNGDTVRISIHAESESGTDDSTVETVLVRVARGGTTPERAVVTTEEGASVST